MTGARHSGRTCRARPGCTTTSWAARITIPPTGKRLPTAVCTRSPGAIDPGIRVLYVDHDPVVLAHGRHMLHGVRGTAIIWRDLLEPAAILTDPELRDLIRLDEPVAVMLLAVVHFIGGDAGPLITELMEPLAPGSYLVISHATADRHPEAIPEAAAVQEIYEQSTTSARPRSRDEILALLRGLDILDPGLVWGPLWRPDPGTVIAEDPAAANMYAVVARKP